jgi:hypothetical protein
MGGSASVRWRIIEVKFACDSVYPAITWNGNSNTSLPVSLLDDGAKQVLGSWPAWFSRDIGSKHRLTQYIMLVRDNK